jgi:hypothetical protein
MVVDICFYGTGTGIKSTLDVFILFGSAITGLLQSYIISLQMRLTKNSIFYTQRSKYIFEPHHVPTPKKQETIPTTAVPKVASGAVPPRFEIKKWNAVAMWSWDICADTVR